jgi:MFS family permease
VGALLGFDAIKLFRDRSFATFMICSFLICIPLSFYFTWTNQFMTEMNVSDPTAKMTLGQVSDVVFLLMLPFLLPRLKAKGILIIGMAAWAVRFSLFALFHQQPTALWMLYTGILLHGMCYDFIFVMGRMYVDKRAGEDIRAAAQGLHAIFTLGAGMFVGSWLSGIVAQKYTHGTMHDWQAIWLIPATMGAVLVIVFALLFKDNTAKEPATT